MVLRAQWPLGTIAQFFHFVAEEKKKNDKKTKAFYDWATTGIPVMKFVAMEWTTPHRVETKTIYFNSSTVKWPKWKLKW